MRPFTPTDYPDNWTDIAKLARYHFDGWVNPELKGVRREHAWHIFHDAFILAQPSKPDGQASATFNLPHVWSYEPLYTWIHNLAGEALVKAIEKSGKVTEGSFEVEVAVRYKK